MIGTLAQHSRRAEPSTNRHQLSVLSGSRHDALRGSGN
jgi:hypothetical protein